MYRSKHDIRLVDFLEYSEIIKLIDDPSVIIQETMRIFYPGKKGQEIERAYLLKKALETEIVPRWYWRKKLIKPKTAGLFIDSDTLVQEINTLEFLKLHINPLSWWILFKGIDNISLAAAEYYVNLFTSYSEPLKQDYPYIYNPPVVANSEGDTLASVERIEFTKHYGGYMEIAYLLTQGDFVDKFDKVMNWDLERFLFQGEYLLRKRYVESLKSK